MTDNMIIRGNMWKALATLLVGIILLTVALAPLPARAATPPIMTTYKVEPETSTGQVGDFLTIDVNAYDIEGMWAWQVDMTWDSAVLGYISHTFSGFLDNQQPEGASQMAMIDFVADGIFTATEATFGVYPGVTAGSALLITMRFEVLSLVDATINIDTLYTYWMEDATTTWGDQAGEMIKENGYFTPPWPEDINMDGRIDCMDLAYVAINWGKSGGDIDPPEADISGDGYVDITDLSMLALLYGQYAGY